MSSSVLVTATGIASIVAGILMTMLWRLFLGRRVWFAGATQKFGKVSAYQLALMNDGASRVALTVVVRLLGREALVAGIAGVLVRNDKIQATLDPFETEAMALTPAVLQGLIRELALALKRKGLIAGLRRELIGMNYMRAFASWQWWVAYVQNMLPFALLIAAVLGPQTDLAIDGDPDLLRDFTLLACVSMLISGLPTAVTAFGNYIIWSATQHHPDYKTARAREGEALDPKKLGQAVALYGFDALAGSDMAWIPAILKHAENSGHDD